MDLQLSLAKALRERNPNAFEAALQHGANPYAPDENKISVYETSLATAGCATFIKLCLQYGASVHYVNQRLNKTAINYVASSEDSENVKVLLEQSTQYKVDVDHKCNELTPLNFLAKFVTQTNIAKIKECMRLLLDYGASPNIADDNAMTPLHYILLNENLDIALKKKLIKMYLQQPNLTIGSELREDFKERMPDIELPVPAELSVEEQLMNELRNDNAERFQELLHRNSGTIINIDYLVECIKDKRHSVLKCLLSSNIDINVKSQTYQKTYVEIAVAYGNWQALNMLLHSQRLQMDPSMQLFDKVIARLDEEEYMKCFKVLLESDQVGVNKLDNSGRAPLHYAILYNNNIAVRMLLEHGAYLGVKSKLHEIPVHNIEPGLLEEYFDSCLTVKESRVNEDFQIVMSYRNFKPSIDKKSKHNEMDSIVAIGESQKHRYLLNHPLISTFITLKWQNICLLHYLYVAFSAICNIVVIANIIKAANMGAQYAFTSTIIFWIIIVCFAATEVLKFYVSRILLSTSRFFNIAHILMLISSSIYSNLTLYHCRVISAFTVIITGVQLTKLICLVPEFSLSLYVFMLKKVILTYLKCSTPFFILIITFALGFQILNIHNLSEQNLFEAIFKTTAMATGEFEEGSIKYQDNIFSKFFLVLFIIFVTVVLMNLLSGLAFDDIQVIRAEAEVTSLVCLVNLLSGYEKFLFGNHVVVPFEACAFPNQKESNMKKQYAWTHNCVELNALRTPDDTANIKLNQNMIKQILERTDRNNKNNNK